MTLFALMNHGCWWRMIGSTSYNSGSKYMLLDHARMWCSREQRDNICAFGVVMNIRTQYQRCQWNCRTCISSHFCVVCDGLWRLPELTTVKHVDNISHIINATPRTLGRQNHEKWRFWTPNIWVITLKMKVVGSHSSSCSNSSGYSFGCISMAGL